MFDLREAYKISANNKAKQNILYNENLIKVLQELLNLTKLKRQTIKDPKEKLKENQRIISIEKGLNTIIEHKNEIKSGKEAIKLDNIGKGLATRIDEILETGTLKELDDLRQYDKISDETKIKAELCKITGIGEVKAEQLIKLGITGIDDLISKWKKGILKVEKNMLTHHIIVGLEFYYDLQERIPWNEANSISKFLQKQAKIINKDLKTTVCGSYRRKLETCGDIDVLLTHPDINSDEDIYSSDYLLNFVKHLQSIGFLVGNLTSEGKTKYMGVLKYKSGLGRRIDIRFISIDSYPCALLYFTGSGLFNKIMRHRANEMGFTINEYGIYKLDKDEKIIVKSEKDIFDIIDCIYLEPHERNFN